MSTLSVGTIKSTSTSPPTVQNSSGTQIGTFCRAWVNFDGSTTTPTIRSSFNVSSITDNGTGDYTINFTNAMPDANYATVFVVGDFNGTNYWGPIAYSFTQTASAARVRNNFAAGTFSDPSGANVAIFR